MPHEIKTFLAQYRDAFNSLDGDAVARLYASSSGIAQGGVYTHWTEYESIRKNMDALCALYRDKGYVKAEFEPVQFIDQGNDYAIVDLRWRIDWNNAQEPWTFKTTYNLVRTSEGWRILLCTAYTEDKLVKAQSAA